ncbi:MAG: RIP metalloprotease RseP [Weeksellaceae bacterium]
MIITILTFAFILVILILIHEFGHFLAAKKNGVLVEEFGIGFPPRLFGKKIGETLYSINLLPLGGFVKLYGEEYHEEHKDTKASIPKHRAFVNKKPWQKAIIIVAGVVMNFLLGWLLITILFIAGTPAPAGVGVAEVQTGSPAQAVGLREGDRLSRIQVNGETIELRSTLDLINTTKEYADKELKVVISREGKESTVAITPRSNPPKGQGSLGIVISQIVETKKYPWYQAPYYGLIQAVDMTKQIATELLKIPAQLISKQKTDVEFSGPIGIAKIVGEAREYGILALLEITALLSLNLAVINILPFPALDGGRMVFVVYEWITGKKPNEKLEQYLNLFGIITLLSLSALITFMDIQKYF